MGSAIRCLACNQKINLAPNASGTMICPMCKTSQAVPEEQGKYAPELSSQARPTTSHPNDENDRASGHDDSWRQQAQNPGNSPPANPSSSFDSVQRDRFDQLGGIGGGCGCLLIGILLSFAAWPAIALVAG